METSRRGPSRELNTHLSDLVDHHRDEQMRLGWEVAVERADCDARQLRNLLHLDPLEVLACTEVRGRLQNPFVPRTLLHRTGSAASRASAILGMAHLFLRSGRR